MKKKIALIGILVVLMVCLCGCGNRQMGFDTTWNFKWAILELGNGEIIEGPVSSWRDFDESDCVQFTMNGVTYLTHYAKVILCTEEP